MIMYMIEDKEDKDTCSGCSTEVFEPYIRCYDCAEEVLLCLNCFARGLEVKSHQNNHRYEVLKNDFVLLDVGWTAYEESNLVAAVAECGLGNWMDVANQLKTKTAKQCEHHYNKCYINNPVPQLPRLRDADITIHPAPMVYRPSEDPPRPADNSSLQQDMSGYMAARGDFTVEHNNYAEMDLMNVDFEDRTSGPVETELKLAAVDVYRDVLKGRNKRKRLVRKYGLINLRKQTLTERKYYSSIGFQRMDRLRSLMKVLTPVEWDMYLESLHYEYTLRYRIKELQDYREQGIAKNISSQIYENLKCRRIDQLSRKTLFEDICNTIKDENICRQWLNKQSKLGNLVKGVVSNLPNLARKSAPPLEIMGLPYYERLTEEEKQLCASVRIVPESYLQYKNILIHEQNKAGHVKLRVARTLIKIDVNKTRKLYDFLCREGYITKNIS